MTEALARPAHLSTSSPQKGSVVQGAGGWSCELRQSGEEAQNPRSATRTTQPFLLHTSGYRKLNAMLFYAMPFPMGYN